MGEPPEGMGKYVSLRRAGNHLYVPPGYKPADLKAATEGVMGSLVAADNAVFRSALSWVASASRASPSPEMLDGAAGDPLLELKGADFGWPRYSPTSRTPTTAKTRTFSGRSQTPPAGWPNPRTEKPLSVCCPKVRTSTSGCSK